MSKNVDKKSDTDIQTRSRQNQKKSAEPAKPIRTSKRTTKLLTPVKKFLKAHKMAGIDQEDEPCRICESNIPWKYKIDDEGPLMEDWLQCDFCDGWLHGIKCEKLSISKFTLITSDINKDWKYKCNKCTYVAVKKTLDERNTGQKAPATVIQEAPKTISDDIREILRQMNDLNKKMDDFRNEAKDDNITLRGDLGAMDLRIISCEAKIANIEANLVFKNKEEFNDTIGPLIKQNIENALKEYDLSNQQEAFQQKIRRKRVLISNIPESAANDKQFVIDFAKELDIEIRHNDIRHCFRIKRKAPPNHPMLIVEFYQERIKYELLDRKTNEKLLGFDSSQEYHKYYIADDKTQKQREINKALSVEAETKNRVLRAQGNADDAWVVRNYGLFFKKKRADHPRL